MPADDFDRLTSLLPLARSHDAEALDILCAYFGPRLLRCVSRMMNEKARRVTDAEDIVQTTLGEMAAIPEHILDAESLGASEAKLTNRAKWRLMDVLRRTAKDRGESAVGDIAPEDDVPSTGPVTGADNRQWLRGLMNQLHGGARDVIELVALLGHSYSSAADILGISYDAVRKRYERASEVLRRLGGEGPGPDLADG